MKLSPGHLQPTLLVRDPQGGLLGFWALIATQFQGAFSDNAMKWLVSFLVLESGVSREQRDFLFVLVVPMVFAIPFLLFSIPGGYFADRFSKRSVTTWTKRLELLTMGFATYVFWKNRLDLAAVALFFICTQEAIFGPSKYGLLPELLPTSKLSWGNGVIELWTLLAAIGGTLAGGFLAHHFQGRQQWSGFFSSCSGRSGCLRVSGLHACLLRIPRGGFTGTGPQSSFWRYGGCGRTRCFGWP